MESIQNQIELYVGIVLAFVFSIVSFYLLFRLVRGKERPNWTLLVVVGATMLTGVTLVGNTPVVSLIQSVVISLGCLYAVYHVVTHRENPNPKVIALLVSAMIVSLLISQASRSFRIGLLEWFQVRVESQTNAKDLAKVVEGAIVSIHSAEGRITKVENDLSGLNRGQADLYKRLDQIEKRFSSIAESISNLEKVPRSEGIAEDAVSSLKGRLDTVEKSLSTMSGSISSLVADPNGEGVAEHIVNSLMTRLNEVEKKLLSMEGSISSLVSDPEGKGVSEDTVNSLTTRLNQIEKMLSLGVSLKSRPQPARNFGELELTASELTEVLWEKTVIYELLYSIHRGLFGGTSFHLKVTDMSLDSDLESFRLSQGERISHRWMSTEGPKVLTITVLTLGLSQAKLRLSDRPLTAAEWHEYVQEIEEERRRREEFFRRSSTPTDEKTSEEPNNGMDQ